MALLRSDKRAKSLRARAQAHQRELMQATGYTGGNAELGHRVAWALRAAGYSVTVATFAGHLCAIAGSWNFQGNWRIAKLSGRSLRTIQRARALLEADNLISSHLLEPGDMIDGQKSPVIRPQVVRDVSKLQAFGRANTAPAPARRMTPRRGKDKAPRGATVKQPAPTPMTADQFESVAATAPEWLQPTIQSAAEFVRSGAGRSRSAAETPRTLTLQQLQVPDLQSHRGRMSAAEIDQALERSNRQKPITEPELAPLSDVELDQLDAELSELTGVVAARRPPDKPPPH